MDSLVILQGPQPGRKFPLQSECTILGRQSDSTICLESLAVSRHHARIELSQGDYFVEDLGSSNGTFLNGTRVVGRIPLTEDDRIQLGPYLFAFRREASPEVDTEQVVRESVSVLASNSSLFERNPTHKLQMVLEIAQHLGATLELDPLLGKFLDHLLRLFPQADRGIALLCEDDRLVVRGQRCRRAEDPTTHTYSRTIVKRALDEGVGILSEDIQADERFVSSATLTGLNMRSLLCVPLISQDGRRVGVIQLERMRPGTAFRMEDLQLLTTVCLLVAIVLENVELHAQVLREERLRQELLMAREIQQGFMPSEFPDPQEGGFELYACLHPARQVSGDLYDFLKLSDGRLAFFLGDVSGKGMPAALYMVAVRSISRHLAAAGESPAETLRKLNAALAADNPSAMFVTLIHGIYTPTTGEVVMASGGHPPPLLRRTNGTVDVLNLKSGRLLGYEGGNLGLSDARFHIDEGETLILYTDGYIEAKDSTTNTMFEVDRLREVLGRARTRLPLAACADQAKAAIDQFIHSSEQQDDLTLFLLRRMDPTSNSQRK